jgi:hypothetical protein
MPTAKTIDELGGAYDPGTSQKSGPLAEASAPKMSDTPSRGSVPAVGSQMDCSEDKAEAAPKFVELVSGKLGSAE